MRTKAKNIQYDTLYNYRDLPTELKRMAREQCVHFVTEPLENAGIINPKIIKEGALSMAKEVAWFIDWDFIHLESKRMFDCLLTTRFSSPIIRA